MRTIRLNNGTTYEIDRCSDSNGILWINLVDVAEMPFSELVFEFEDVDAVSVIVDSGYEDKEKTYTGYTQLMHISRNPFGTQIGLAKPN